MQNKNGVNICTLIIYVENIHEISNYGYGYIKENILQSHLIFYSTLRDITFNLIYRIMYYLVGMISMFS